MAACLFFHTAAAHAYPLTQCAGDRFGSDLGCTANDVSITNIAVTGGTNSCTGGSTITVDLDITVNFASPDRWDVGIFISNDGKDPQTRSSNGGAASCSVAILPTSSPFLNLDNDGCGDGNGTIGGGTGSGHLIMTNVTVPCKAITGSTGNLYIPFVVSWDNQKTPPGAVCSSSADPVPNTKSKCNAPLVSQGTVSVVVLPTITKTDGIAVITPGDSTTYTVVITNTTGDTLSTAVFKDPAIANLSVGSVSCVAAGGATCPASLTVAAMQGAGITIPPLPVNGSVTFTINATLTGNPAGTITNTASVTVGGQTASAGDTDTIVYPSLTVVKSVQAVYDPVNLTSSPKAIPGAEMAYTVQMTNTGQGHSDNNSMVVTDSIPANTSMCVSALCNNPPVAFSCSVTPACGLTYNYAADVTYSNHPGGVGPFDYITLNPDANGYDPAVTGVRINPKGILPGAGGGNPSFSVFFKVRVK